MDIFKSLFKAKLIGRPEVIDDKTKESKEIGVFTIGKRYRVYDVFDNGRGFTDFLVADDQGVFYWINMSVFRSG